MPRVPLIDISQITKLYNLTNFCVTRNMFHHKHKDKSFSGVNKKQVMKGGETRISNFIRVNKKWCSNISW